MKKIILFLIILIGFGLNLFAQDESSGKLSGYMFGDYYYIVKNHNSDLKDQHGFWFRRIYFTYDYKINQNWSTRLRLEMNQEGDFTSKIAMVPVVKDAWLRYKFSGQSIYVGISSTPTWSLIEDVWGYRSLEKTPLDLNKMASSRDFGIAGKGKFDEDGIFNYHVMFGNGSSNKQEIDKGKSGMLSLSAKLKNGLILEFYGDYADHAGNTDTYILQGFAAFQMENFRIGAQYAYQLLQQGSESDKWLRLASVFAVGDVSENVSLLARVDRTFNQNPKGDDIAYIPLDPTAKYTLLIFGVDWHPIKNVKIIPNIEYVSYSKNSEGVTPDEDLFSRITFYWSFN